LYFGVIYAINTLKKCCALIFGILLWRSCGSQTCGWTTKVMNKVKKFPLILVKKESKNEENENSFGG
jgi:hypothetical protein